MCFFPLLFALVFRSANNKTANNEGRLYFITLLHVIGYILTLGCRRVDKLVAGDTEVLTKILITLTTLSENEQRALFKPQQEQQHENKEMMKFS